MCKLESEEKDTLYEGEFVHMEKKDIVAKEKI